LVENTSATKKLSKREILFQDIDGRFGEVVAEGLCGDGSYAVAGGGGRTDGLAGTEMVR
jgi:hypothetical protein